MQARFARIHLSWLAVSFALAQLADLITAWQVNRELNPIAAALASQPLAGLAVKIALVIFVVTVAELNARRRPGLARGLLLFGMVAGLAGAVSNTHLTPFVGA
jgi:uncharacterized protein DUF5658